MRGRGGGVPFWIMVQYRPSFPAVLGHSYKLPLFPCDVVEEQLKIKGLFHDFLLLRINGSCYKLDWFVITPRCRVVMGEGGVSSGRTIHLSAVQQYDT